MMTGDPAFAEFFAGFWQDMLDRTDIPGLPDASWDRKAAWLYWMTVGKVEPMSSTFCIVNLATGECTTTAPTPELIEAAYHAGWAKRGPEQVIVEFPAAFGVTITNFKTFPSSMVYDGIATYARRKVAAIAERLDK